MLKDKKLIAVIPVRGGSKGIPGKNLYKIRGETILERAIKLGLASDYVDDVRVSTDNEEMYRIADHYGVATPSFRPSVLAGDDARTVDVTLHVLEEVGFEEGFVMLLQVTTPLRTLQELESVCKLLESDRTGADSVVSLVRFDDPHPDKVQKIENGYVESYLGKESMVPRQSLPPVYALNGAFYLTEARILREKGSFFTSRTLPFVMPQLHSINLDTMRDVYYMEMLLERKLVELEELPVPFDARLD